MIDDEIVWYKNPRYFFGFMLEKNGKPNEFDIFGFHRGYGEKKVFRVGRLKRFLGVVPLLVVGQIYLLFVQLHLLFLEYEPLVVLFCSGLMVFMVFLLFAVMLFRCDYVKNKAFSSSCGRCR